MITLIDKFVYGQRLPFLSCNAARDHISDCLSKRTSEVLTIPEDLTVQYEVKVVVKDILSTVQSETPHSAPTKCI
eukprot:3603931-Amphidinium_carterae.1